MLKYRFPASSSGLTLVELVASLVILAVIGFLSGGAIKSMGRMGALREATEGLVAALREGQSRALGSGHEHGILVSAAGWQLLAHHDRGEMSVVRGESFPIGVRGPAQGDVHTLLHFFPSGVVTPKTILLTAETARSRTTVSLRGRITVTIE